jgi:chromosome condensin MukBEF MukE localization factor
MPAMTLRGRYLMREYWSDSDLFLRLTAEEREVYVGLWMLADDSGWLPRDIEAIGANLAQYVDREPRSKRIRAALDRLRAIGKVESLRCGCLHLPAVERYPRAGQKSADHLKEHQRHLTRDNQIKQGSKPSPVPSLPDPSLPVVADARAPDGAASDFQRRVPRPA